ncbi:hypothetical protein VARIO8X_150108 [Burkholderiales bacterium 8X]|nr:hypothetical protein VARIO8X_150108 [Burkholderiales bacterium 8X]
MSRRRASRHQTPLRAIAVQDPYHRGYSMGTDIVGKI